MKYMSKPLNTGTRLRVALVFVVSLALAGCSVNTNKDSDGRDKNVDIRTPLGAIHVDEGAAAGDTGLPVYPGARPKKKDKDDGDSNANVNLSAFGYGLRVVALEYRSDDAPAKIIAYYKDQLKKYGSVLECHTSSDITYNRKESGKSGALSCGQDSGSNVELKVGTTDNQHIVSVKPDGKGATFALVYVETHGRNTI